MGIPFIIYLFGEVESKRHANNDFDEDDDTHL